MNIRQAQLPEGWELKTWNEVLEIRSGRNQKEVEDPNGKFPILGSAGKVMGYANNYICQEGTTIIGRKGTINNPMLIEEKFWNVDTAFGLHAKNDLNKFFLHYFCLGFDFTKMDRGSGRPSLVKSDLLKIKMLVPPLPEQQRIVSLLDRAFSAIDQAKANAEKNLQNAKELFESYLEGVFENGGDGWKATSLGNVCKIDSNLVDPKEKRYQNFIHIGAGNIESKTGKLSNLKTAKEEGLISGKFIFDERMILYSKIRPYLEKIVACEFKGLCSADIYPLLPQEKVLYKDFLYFLLLTKKFTDYAVSGSARAGMPKVNRKHLFEYRFHLPLIEKQQSIASSLKKLRTETQNLEASYKKKIAALDDLKKSILQKAFRGELTEPEETLEPQKEIA